MGVSAVTVTDCVFQVGCEDGTVKIFEIQEERVQFVRNLDRQKGEQLVNTHLCSQLTFTHATCDRSD